jgi:hypothetical protein
VAIADINGDNKPDLVVACFNPGNLVILTNAGGGIFVTNTAYAVSNVIYVLATDINGDTKPDLITCDYNGIVTVLTNAGGTFLTTFTIQTGFGSWPENIGVADLNGDGKPDLIVPAAGTGQLMVLTNAGGGIFQSNAVYSAFPYFIAAADFNYDGKVDIACADNGAATVTVFTNAGNGVLVQSQTFSGRSPVLLAADLDGDSRTDLVARLPLATGGAALTPLFNSGSGGVFVTNYLSGTNFINVLLPDNGINWAAAEDMNGDGKPDFVLGAHSGLYVFTNNISPFIRIGTPTNVTVEATGPSGAVATFSTVTATNWTGALTVTNSPPSGSTFPLGITTVTSTASYFITATVSASTNKTFTVTVQDTTLPTLTLLGANPLTNFVNNYFEPGATAIDTVWGNLTGSIQISGNLMTNVPGDYTVSYSVTDGSGNTATTNREVVIIPVPPTNIAASGNQVGVFWQVPPGATNYVLQTTTNLASGNWVDVTNGAPLTGVFVTNAAPASFFRLKPQ